MDQTSGNRGQSPLPPPGPGDVNGNNLGAVVAYHDGTKPGDTVVQNTRPDTASATVGAGPRVMISRPQGPSKP